MFRSIWAEGRQQYGYGAVCSVCPFFALQPVFVGCQLRPALKNFKEVAGVGESDPLPDFGDGQVGLLQIELRFIHPDVLEVVDEGLARFFLK
ncbi:hypothetical protein D3C81_1448590 [compost metagenome]